MNTYNPLIIVLFITFGLLLTPLFFIGFDYWAGLRKAHQRKERITSDKMKRTSVKIARYYNMLLALLVLDAMQISGFWYLNAFAGWHIPLFPLLVFCGSLFVGGIEIKSILEPADEKERREMIQVAALAQELAKHRTEPTEIAKAVADYINTNNIKINEVNDGNKGI